MKWRLGWGLDPLGLLLAIIAALPAVYRAPNRLLPGEPIWLHDGFAGSTPFCVATTVLAFALLGASVAASRGSAGVRLVAGGALAASLAQWWLAIPLGAGARQLSLSAGSWLTFVFAAALIGVGIRDLRGRALVTVSVVAAVVLAVAPWKEFERLGVVQEALAYQDRWLQEVVTHLELAWFAVGLGFVLAVPLALLAHRSPRLRALIDGVLSLANTIPSIATFGVLMTLVGGLRQWAPAFSERLGSAASLLPVALGLTIYGLLPLVRSTLAAWSAVDDAAVEAARGMGMTPWQLWWKVEVPLAAPVALEGVRIAVVLSVGLTTVAALVGAGGLGTLVFMGVGQGAEDLVALGAFSIIALGLVCDGAFRLLIGGLRRLG